MLGCQLPEGIQPATRKKVMPLSGTHREIAKNRRAPKLTWTLKIAPSGVETDLPSIPRPKNGLVVDVDKMGIQLLWDMILW